MEAKIINYFKKDPYAYHLGIELVECTPGYAKARAIVPEYALNFHGYTHGGFIFSLADYAFAAASNSHGQTAVGLNVHMSYLSPGKIGDGFVCEATETKRTPKIAVYDIKVSKNEGDLVASMEGMVYIKKERFAEKM